MPPLRKLPDLLVDDEGFTKHVCPEQNANICSRLTFEWMGPLMKLGHERPLEKEDVWMLPQKQHKHLEP